MSRCKKCGGPMVHYYGDEKYKHYLCINCKFETKVKQKEDKQDD